MKLILKTDHTITGQNITFISPEYCISWPYHDDHLLPLPARSSSSFRAVYQFFHDIIAGISSAVFNCDHFVTKADLVSFCHFRGFRHLSSFQRISSSPVISADFRHISSPVTFCHFCRISSSCADFVGDFVTDSFLRAIRLERVDSAHGS